MCEKKFYICKKCGNIVELVHSGGGSLVCCGEKMTPLCAGEVEASHEKHIPVVNVNGDTVHAFVGSVEHPMTEEHSIDWIYLQTDKGGYRKNVRPGEKPEAYFTLNGEKPIAVYAYCNLHGLWKTEI